MEKRPPPSEPTNHLLRRIAEESERWPSARVAFCATRQGESRFVPATALFLFGDFPLSDVAQRRYLTHRFAFGVVSQATAIESLKTLVVGDDPFGCESTTERPMELAEGLETGAARTITGWPELVFRGSSSIGTPTVTTNEPLLAYGETPFASGEHAYDELFLSPFGLSLRRGGTIDKLRVIVPDRSGRVREGEIKGRSLAVECEGELLAETEVHVVTRDRSYRPGSLPPVTGAAHITFELDDSVFEATVNLIHRARGVLSTYRVARASSLQTQAQESALADLQGRGSERDCVEFKPFIKPHDEKEREIVRTLVAFANSGGGRLYIGVADDGEPQGKRALFEIAKGVRAAETRRQLADRVRILAAEMTKPVVECRVDETEVSGHPIILVTVPAGSSPPYANQGDEIFTRRGARTYRASVPEIKELFGARGRRTIW